MNAFHFRRDGRRSVLYLLHGRDGGNPLLRVWRHRRVCRPCHVPKGSRLIDLLEYTNDRDSAAMDEAIALVAEAVSSRAPMDNRPARRRQPNNSLMLTRLTGERVGACLPSGWRDRMGAMPEPPSSLARGR